MARCARFRVIGRFDKASRVQQGTVTINRDAGLFTVRPLRRHKEFTLPLDKVADMVVQALVKAEVAARKAAKKAARKARSA